MSTKEKIYNIMDTLTPENIELVYQMLKRFAIAQSVQEDESFGAEHIETGIQQIEEGKIVVKSMEELEEMANE